MGLRGPGARPVKIAPKRPSKGRKQRASWKRARLSRSERVIRFVESLTITAGDDAGKPFKLRDWQKEIIRRVYDPVGEDGRRLVRTALLTMARKNGKMAWSLRSPWRTSAGRRPSRAGRFIPPRRIVARPRSCTGK